MMNGPKTELQNHKQKLCKQTDSTYTVDRTSGDSINVSKQENSHDDHGRTDIPLALTTSEFPGGVNNHEKFGSFKESLNESFKDDLFCACVSEIDLRTDLSTDAKRNRMMKDSGTHFEQELTNGTNCHDRKETVNMLNSDEQGNIVGPVHNNVEEPRRSDILETMHRQPEDLGKLPRNSGLVNEPLSTLTKMVQSICLESKNVTEGIYASSLSEKCRPDPSHRIVQSDVEHTAACSTHILDTEIEQSIGIVGPTCTDLNDKELEELPSSLSDFVLGCQNNQSAVPPCPPSDIDINTIHIQKDEHLVSLVPYKSEAQMPDIMRLITKDLSEPYSIYTYRYFIHNWPQLCFLAMHKDKCIGAIVCKLDVHKKMVRRGYIAMLAVDENYRKLQIGSSLVKKAIRTMVRGECDEVVLETEITNKPALRLYENLGFVRDKRLFRYYLNGVDALRLKLWLR